MATPPERNHTGLFLQLVRPQLHISDRVAHDVTVRIPLEQQHPIGPSVPSQYYYTDSVTKTTDSPLIIIV